MASNLEFDHAKGVEAEEFVFPASFAQQRMWFVEQLMPEGGLYNIPFAVRLQGPLHAQALEESLREIIWRHESLRTRFEREEEQLLQVIATNVWFELPVLEVEAGSAEEQERLVQEIARREARTAFQLERDLLLRATLLRLGEQDHVLVVTMHHIVSDGWSIDVLIREMITLYEAFAKGQESPLPELPIQYADYAHWQQEWLQGEVLEQQLTYWKQQLGAGVPALQLPTDRPRLPLLTYEGRAEQELLTSDLALRLRTFCQQQGVTLFMALLGAFQTLLFRYSQQVDFGVGTPIAGRNRKEAEGLIGFFVNTLVMRADLEGDPSFAELVGRVRTTALAAYDHQDLPFEKLVEELKPERDLSRSPLFQVMFVLENAALGDVQVAGLRMQPVAIETGVAKFDLLLTVKEQAEGLLCQFEYNTHLFEAATVQRMSGHFQRLLEAAVAAPDCPISQLTWLEEEERAHLLTGWNDTAVEYPQDVCLQELFARQVQRTPDAVAVVYEETALSYQELDRRAEELARHLQQLGVAPGSLVGVCLERSVEMVVALIGVLKAGGAYVPIDPTLPSERVSYLLEDSQVCVLLTQERFRQGLDLQEVTVVCLQGEGGYEVKAEAHNEGQLGNQASCGDNSEHSHSNQADHHAPLNLQHTTSTRPVTAEDPAYMIYTSGSTGLPKGVLNSHRGIVNRLLWMQEEYQLTERDRVLQKTPYSFDVSVWEFFWPLITGACLVVAKPEGHRDSRYLLELIREQEITTLHFVPSMLQVFLEEPGIEQCESVRQVMCSGEALPYELQERYFERMPRGAKLHNLYGPTEAAVDVTYWECQPGNSLGFVPIGRPVANTQLYILDEHLQPVPIGVSGELYIGGVQVAIGYHNRPELTAERFVHDPFSAEPQARLYKTGDRARFLPDGSIQYLGRLDFQVKLRGFRIELGEIEAVLEQHPHVQAAVVVAQQLNTGDQRLVGYVVAKESDWQMEPVRHYLQERLPEYMVPSALVRLNELPLTPNGKVDRRALPAPDVSQMGVGHAYVAPRNPIETQVAALWHDVLQVELVGALDNFFDLGGHSLLAMQVITRLNTFYNLQLSLRHLFESPTVASLAERIAEQVGGWEEEGVRHRASVAQQRIWMIDQLADDKTVHHLPFALHLRGDLDIAALERSVNRMLERHEALRTTFREVDGVLHQVVHPAMRVDIDSFDLQKSSTEDHEGDAQRGTVERDAQLLAQHTTSTEDHDRDVQLWKSERAARSFDLQAGPLLHVDLLNVQADTYILLITAHQIVFDRPSVEVFLSDFAKLYAAESQGVELEWEVPAQLIDHVQEQAEWLASEQMGEQLAYWKQKWGDEAPVLQLPTDFPRPPVQTYRSDEQRFLIPPHVAEKLSEVAHQHDSTVEMALFSAFQILLARHSGQVEFGVGMPMEGRHDPAGRSLIGCVEQRLAMRADLSEAITFADLLKRVSAETREARQHGNLPFETLLEQVQPERDTSRAALFQVLFRYEKEAKSAPELPGLTQITLETWTPALSYDLALELVGAGADGIQGTFVFNTDLFTTLTIQRMIGHLETLLDSIVADSNQSVRELSLLTEAELQQILYEWNDTAVAYPTDRCVHQLFEDQVARTPERVALMFGQDEMTYQELNERANRLAHALQKRGVGPECRVALCTERSFDMVVGLLGVLKAGGAYVPIDPAYPQDRLVYLLEDSEPALLLTQEPLLELVSSYQGHVLLLDADWEEIEQESASNPQSDVTLHHLAYVIYTSGSTGRPKGVLIEHTGVGNMARAQREAFEIDEESCVLQFASLSFDASVSELFITLLCGAKLVLGSREDLLPGPSLARLLQDNKVTVATFPPSLLAVMQQESFPDLKTIISAGEACSTEVIQYWAKGRKFLNAYGPTEVTVVATWSVCASDQPTPHIGKPIANKQVYILDESLQPVPVGVVGELYIGGVGLARGYHNRPDLTEEKFLPHPFAKASDAQVYKTGDLVRWRADGNIEYIGRIDDQVKLRGFRIELGEIEVALRESPAVQDAVVIVREGTPGAKRLVAYIVPRPQQADETIHDLKANLQQRLPEHLVPSAIVKLAEFPLTPNGKVDRRQLPAPDRTDMGREYLAPRTTDEELVCELWAQVLQVEQEQVGVYDHFFEMGGHSLLATRVFTRLQGEQGLSLPLRTLFECPTVERFAEKVAEARRQLRAGRALVIEPISRDEPLVLSFAQERLWVLDQLEPGSAVYNIPVAVRFQGELDRVAFSASLNGILQRHEALRTVFAKQEGQPVQVILPATERELPVIDLRDLKTLDEREQRLTQLLHEEAVLPFDLREGPLVRFFLVQLSEAEHVLALNMHHIVSDGWSMTVFIDEFVRLYEASVLGTTATLPELPLQYADFASHQRHWMQGEVLEAQLAYWRQQLGGELPILKLPTDRARPPVQTHRGAGEKAVLSRRLSDELQSLSQQRQVTLFMTLLAAYQTLLARYTGQEDICVGSPIAGRTAHQTEGMIGFFVNTPVMRTDLSGDPTFTELLERVREVALGAYEHQDIPFEKLVSELVPQRDLSQSPLFQTMFVLQNTPKIEIKLPGLSLDFVDIPSFFAKFDLLLAGLEQEDELVLYMEYNTDLFEQATVRQMLDHLVRLLEGIVVQPDARLSELPMLSEAEQQLLVQEWSGRASEVPNADACIHELFEEQVMKTPEATALACAGRELSYAELNRQADRLAHRLQQLGVGPDVLVGLCLERSFEMIVGMLGVLKAGGAYLPLDPAYPAERLAFMMSDSGMQVLLTQAHLQAEIPLEELRMAGISIPILNVDLNFELEKEIANEPSSRARVDQALTPDHLCYVMYTSGSTGKPKGVQITHRGVVNHSRAVQEPFRLQPADRVMQFSSVSFDIAVEEIYPTLAAGATLVLRPERQIASATEFLRFLREERITVLNLPTAYWHSWVREMVTLEAELPEALRLVVVGGEKASSDVYATWRLLARQQVEWINTYGPTETTVTATLYQPATDSQKDGEGIPIGRPIAGVHTYVLDAHRKPVPMGVAGELHIGGAGVARGYLHQPALTASAFVPNPFATSGERLYRTGDLVRYRQDGTLEYLGRLDNQVKIRGYRIEVGEIEATLGQLDFVQESLVVPLPLGDGGQRLVAYLVAEAASWDVGRVRQFLKERLPDYMVPTAFLRLDKLPLTPNGKVDRRALPSPDPLSGLEASERVLPRTELEQEVARIWSDLLKVEPIGVHDNFFLIGGHSLLGVQVLSRLQALLGMQVSLRTLFEKPTVAELAEQMERQLADGEGHTTSSAVIKSGRLESLPLIRMSSPKREGRYSASFAQRRLWVVNRLVADHTVYNMPFAVRLQGELDVQALTDSLNEIIRRHEVLRTVFAEEDGQPLQVILPYAHREFLCQDLSNLLTTEREEAVERHIQAVVNRAFDLEVGPLFHAELLKLDEAEHLLVLSMHHIISDGWSIGVLMREMGELYSARRSDVHGEQLHTVLPELTVQYADYAAWQQDWLQGEIMDEQLAYWKQVLGGDLPLLQLSTDRPRPAVQSQRGSMMRFALSRELSERLELLSQQQGVTLFMTLLAAFQTLLARYSGQSDLLIGTPVAGRNRTETEGMIGFFVNTLVLRTDVSDDPTFGELQCRVRETVLSAFAHQDMPFEKLVEELQPERDRSRSSVFQVMFAMQNTPFEELTLPNLQMSSVDIEMQNAKYDLTLLMGGNAAQIEGAFEYSTDLFDSETMERMILHFQTLLQAVVVTPDETVHTLPLLTAEQREQEMTGWNNTTTPYPHDQTVHQIFEELAERIPDQTAVWFAQEKLSYGELNAKANRLARYLQSQGVEAGQRIGLCVERSLDAIIALLAILKAGCAYVPIDAAYPEERITTILEDAEACLFLTYAHRMPNDPTIWPPAILLDQEEQMTAIAQMREENLRLDMSSESLAYLTYTSGSTGRPKGVCITHRGILRLVKEATYIDFAPSEVFLQFATLAFDAVTFEIWGSLLNGAQLVLYPGRQASTAEMGDVLKRYGVTTVFMTTALFHFFIDEDPSIFQPLRQLLVGGEAITPKHVNRFLEQVPTCRFFNVYGPTESTTFASIYEVHQPLEPGMSVPIGHPISNTTLYVLDSHLQPLPMGVAGELYIGGDGLALGYYNQPELTENAFLTHSFDGTAATRLYKTGDLVRRLPDGALEFLGRIDNQVKIRGFRIELAEIEAVLALHPLVMETVVLVQEATPGEKRIIAYVVPQDGAALAGAELRQYLKSRLPEFMIPAGFVLLEALPLTRNGKVDRRALPAPDGLLDAQAEDYTPPRSQMEEIVAGVFADVLRAEQVGAHDHFFERGGHSLLATQAISRLNEALGMTIPLQMLFEAPTVESFATEVELRRWLAGGEMSSKLELPPLEARDASERSTELELSFAQQRLWVLEQLLPATGVYNIPYALRLQGQLDVTALERALCAIVARHEVLRTTFVEREGQPWQVIAEAVDFTLPYTDLRTVTEEERAAAVERLVQAEAGYPFDLSAEQLMRSHLIHLAEEEHIFLVNLHHIVADGWSIGVFVQEFSALYAAFVAGEPSPLQNLSLQYADYARWQRQWLQGDVLEEQLSYWKQQLAGELPALQLPTDRPRPLVQTHVGRVETFTVESSVAQALQQLSRRLGVTLFMTLLGAYQTLLHRYSGQEDILVGTPIAGRRRSELEGLIGFFVNTLVMRTQVTSEMSFTDLLRQVRATALGAFAHQDLPFEKLVEELQIERDTSRTPLFQAMFVLQNAPEAQLELPHLQVRQVEYESRVAKFDLTLTLIEQADGLFGTLEYNSDLYDSTTMQRFVGHFRTLLESIAQEPTQRLHELPILTDEERTALITAWQGPEVDVAPELCVHHLVERQATRMPEAPAILFEKRTMTYGELNRYAQRLARQLRDLGVGPNKRVGLSLHRSPEMIVALLAVLQAGGGYVALDPFYPAERLAFMMEDAGIEVLVTDVSRPDFFAGHCLQIKPMSAEAEWVDGEELEELQVPVSPDHLAYLLYTSGSTGRPKGVQMPHRPLVNLLQWQREQSGQHGIGAHARTLQFASLNFDVSFQEIFSTLTSGGTLVIPTEEQRKDPEQLLELLEAYQVERLFLPFVMLQQLAEVADVQPDRRVPLREIITAGEQLQITPAIRSWCSRLPDCTLQNQYGPSETHVATAFTLQGEPNSWPMLPPIGRPIDNAVIYLLDAWGEPVPMGVPGEVYIGGVCVAHGYQNRPDLTSEKFRHDPFAAEKAEKQRGAHRLYRTGDLARRLSDGTLMYLGRIDQQVKLRGYRIELGEVETRILEHPTVSEAVVLVRTDLPGDNRLIAYLVPSESSSLEAEELDQFLRQSLPEYMVPSAYVVLEKLPVTPSNKIDRKALPMPTAGVLERKGSENGDTILPRDAVEQRLAQIWQNLLGLQTVGVRDDFFRLGGHSLLAVRVMAEVRREFGHTLPLTALYQGSTIEHLSNLLREQTGGTKHSSLVPIQEASGSAKRPLFLVHPVGGIAHVYVELAQELGVDQPVYGLQARGLEDGQAPHATLEEMAQAYVEEVRTVQVAGPYLLGGWSLGGVVAYEMAQQLRALGEEVALVAMFDTVLPTRADAEALDVQDERALVLAFAEEVSSRFHLPPISKERVQEADTSPLFEDLLQRAAHEGTLPPQFGMEQLLPYFEVFKANLLAHRAYQPKPYAGEIVQFNATEDAPDLFLDITLGWGELCADLQVHLVSGRHGNLVEQPHVHSLAALLSDQLQKLAIKQ